MVSGDFPYPPNHGGRKDVWDKINALIENGYKVDLISTIKETPTDIHLKFVEELLDNVLLIKRNMKIRMFFSFLPMQYKSREQLANVKLVNQYDYVLVEGDYVLPILNNPEINGEIIFRMHNNEARYFIQLMKSEKSIFKKLYYFTESFKFKVLNNVIISKLKTIWFISMDELKEYSSSNPEFRGYFVPPHVEQNFSAPNIIDNKNVLFIGSLFMVNNVEAVIWYLINVHDYISEKYPNYTFIIAGNTKNQTLSWLYNTIKSVKFKGNIEIIESPEYLDDLYSKCSIFVNPMQHGAGIKLKTIEPLQKGLAVVSTPIGAEGTGLENEKHIMIAHSQENFIESVDRLLSNEQMRINLVKNSQYYLSENYDLIKKLNSLFSQNHKKN